MKKLSGIIISLVMLGVSGCAGGVGPLTVASTVDITGKWVGSWATTNPALVSGTIEMRVTQTESQRTGTSLVSGAPTDPRSPTAAIVSENEGRVERPGNAAGSFTVQRDTMKGKGNIQGVIGPNATLARQQ